MENSGGGNPGGSGEGDNDTLRTINKNPYSRLASLNDLTGEAKVGYDYLVNLSVDPDPAKDDGSKAECPDNPMEIY